MNLRRVVTLTFDLDPHFPNTGDREIMQDISDCLAEIVTNGRETSLIAPGTLTVRVEPH